LSEGRGREKIRKKKKREEAFLISEHNPICHLSSVTRQSHEEKKEKKVFERGEGRQREGRNRFHGNSLAPFPYPVLSAVKTKRGRRYRGKRKRKMEGNARLVTKLSFMGKEEGC